MKESITELVLKNRGSLKNTIHHFGISNHTINILEALIRSQELTLVEIEKQAKLSNAATYIHLNKLVSKDIIIKNGKEYSINKHGIDLYNGIKHLI